MAKKALKMSHNKNVLRFFLGLTFALILFMAFAAFTNSAKAADEQEVYQRARTRSYLGGVDESDLKVLPFVPATKDKKKNENQEEGF